MTRALKIALGMGLIAAGPLSAQPTPPGSGQVRPLFSSHDAVVATVFTGASVALMHFDSRIALYLRRPLIQDDRTLDAIADAASLVNEKSLLAAGILAYAGGRLAGGRTVADVGWHVSEAIIFSGVASTIVRGALGRSRPFVTADEDAFDYSPGKGFAELSYRAFPSIHAVASFATASVLVGELSHREPGAARWLGPPIYALAALPGLGRMYKDKHWASDVLMGAFVGTFAGRKVVRYHHSRPETKLDRIMLGAAPTVDRVGRPALELSFRF